MAAPTESYDRTDIQVTSQAHDRFGKDAVVAAVIEYLRQDAEEPTVRRGVPELEPDAWELAADAAAAEAHDRLRASLGVRPLHPERVRMHVLDRATFRERISKHLTGVTYVTHCYVMRSAARHWYLSHLCHERFHAGAYKRSLVQVFHSPEVEGPDPVRLLRRDGLAIHFRKDGAFKKSFEGLNEAVTEIGARLAMRDVRTGTTLLLDEAGRPPVVTRETSGYEGHVRVVESVFGAPPRDHADYPGHGIRQLMADAMTGSLAGVRSLAGRDRTALRALARMDSGRQDAFVAAATLGLPFAQELAVHV
jgi:hypothetical protein